jgi:hypothetical protein
MTLYLALLFFFLTFAGSSAYASFFTSSSQLLKLDGKTNLRLCDEATLLETCRVQKGSLSYLALLNDKEAGKVKFAIDKALLDDAVAINAHPLRCDRTTSVAPAGEETFQTLHAHPVFR